MVHSRGATKLRCARKGELQGDPSKRPKASAHSYSKDGAMRVIPVSDPVCAPNFKGGPRADPTRAKRRAETVR
jgi:hypothetical protein